MTKSARSYLTCPSCRRQYFNNKATLRCPHCGHRVRWRLKYAGLWVSVTVVAALVALAVIELAGR